MAPKMAEELRPAKRQRKGVPIPDGFQVSNSVLRPNPVSVPHFVSAFDQGSEGSATDGRKKIASTRRVERRVPVPISHPEPSTSKARSTAGVWVDQGGKNLKAKSEEMEKEKVAAVSVLDAPKKIILANLNKQKAAVDLRPARPPAVVASFSSSTSAGPSSALKQVMPPVLKPPSRTNAKPLQPLQQPAIPVNLGSGKGKEKEKDFRALSTTGLGLGLLQSTQNGAADELVGILLRDQHPEMLVSAREEEEEFGEHAARRGLEMSPEKTKGRGTSAKYIRGGLAADASAYFDRSLTAFVLWKKEIERRPNAFPSEFSVSVAKILHMPLPSRSHSKFSTSMNSTSPGIALCRIHLPNDFSHPSLKADHLYRAVFSFPNAVDSGDAMSPAQFLEGKTISVFKPWHEASLCSVEGADHDMSGATTEGGSAPRLLASLPLPLSEPYSTPDPLDAPVSDMGLFITRFYIKS